MAQLVDETARIVSNEQVGPRLHILQLEAPLIAQGIMPGQFVHMRILERGENVLRRPFSVYARDKAAGTIEILYQQVGTITDYMPSMKQGNVSLIGPVGTPWNVECSRALLVGGGVGAAPLFLLAETLAENGTPFDVVLGAQTEAALVARSRYGKLIGSEPFCATDDGSYGRPGFCTSLVSERLEQGCSADGKPYDFMAVCGPEPLMRLVAEMGGKAGVRTQLSLEKRMACGVGACLSCVVNTTSGKKRSCVDGPVFEAEEVVW